MSLLIVTPVLSRTQALADDRVIRALAEARRQGFSAPEEFDWTGGAAWWFSRLQGDRGSGASFSSSGRFAAYVGTTQWRGLTRRALLERLITEFERPAQIPIAEFSGSFAMLFAGPAGVWLFGDAIGIQKIYQTADLHLISTSFLVCRATIDHPRIERMRAQEYVLLGANHGLETPFADIRLLDPTMALALDRGERVKLHRADALRQPPQVFRSENEAVSGLSAALIEEFRRIVDAFGQNIAVGLSGGFDSRLILAALERLGVRPHLYVYGGPHESDVRVAAALAARLGMSIDCIDKQSLNARCPPLTLGQLTGNLTFFDGLPAHGAFDRGADRMTRLRQSAGGRLILNGGGGEIFRNFFGLPDKPLTAGDVVSAFYAYNWIPQSIASPEERAHFMSTIGDEILRSLELASNSPQARSQRLPRSDIALAYTLFRLRYWMGRNNSNAARYGSFITPFAKAPLASMCAFVPLRWKQFGALEARIITSLSPRVASGPNAHGFDFSLGPGFGYRWGERASMCRPLAVRKRMAVIRHLLGRNRFIEPPPEWRAIAETLPPQDWIDAGKLIDADQLSRLLTLRAVMSDSWRLSSTAEGVGNESQEDAAVT